MRSFLFVLSVFILFAASRLSAQKTDLKFIVKGCENQSVVLGYYFNKQLLVKDTIELNGQGEGRYASQQPLPQGVYVAYLPNQEYLDFIVGGVQNFTLSTSKENMLANTTISGSEESKKFLDYQKFIAAMQLQLGPLQKQQEANPNDEKLKQELQSKFSELDKQVKSYMRQLADNNDGSFLSLFMKGVQEIEIPDFKQQLPSLTVEQLQEKRYFYYRNHYFDNFNLSDDRLLRTPFFTSKLENYFKEILPQIPDTVASEAIALIERTKTNPEMFKYVTSYLYNLVNESKIMGMDAALVQLAEKYYLSGLASWADPKFVGDLRSQVEKIKYTLIGEIAPDLKMGSFDQQYFRLHEVSAPFTILVFWETDCGHCKKEIPLLHKVWSEKLSHDAKVFCVYTMNKKEEWTEFIEENHLDGWIHVYDPRYLTNFRYLYNITSTPQIFVLDKDKKIVAKKISAEQLADVINYLKNNQ